MARDYCEMDNFNIILRQPIKKDIVIRANLGLNMECVTMCGGNINKFGEFTLDDAINWYERIIQHPCKWVIEYNDNCIGAVGLRPYKEDIDRESVLINGTYCSDIYMGIIRSDYISLVK